ncbi:hypothetical protein CHIBITOTORO_00190 [Serratia phage vB_SmaM-ChibiTotoro]|nr:hypothetical protein CHIBITOTORO_00190 [Serratia phage vB_SmaM-ChibiTotoro]
MIELKPIAHILYNQFEGKPHYTEFCISDNVGDLQEEADRENDQVSDGCGTLKPGVIVSPVYGPETVNALAAENEELQVRISTLEALLEDAKHKLETPIVLAAKYDPRMAGDKATKSMFYGHNTALNDCAKTLKDRGFTVEHRGK